MYFMSNTFGKYSPRMWKNSASVVGRGRHVRSFTRYPKSYPLWNVTHFTLELSTTPLTISSSPKRWTSIPRSSCALKSIPECFSNAMESCAYMSSFRLNSRKLNCHMQ